MNYLEGKGGVFHKLINLMPPNEDYIETYFGGGAIMRNKSRALRDIGIEIDPQVIEMWDQNKHIDFELIHDDLINYLKFLILTTWHKSGKATFFFFFK